MEDGIFPDLLTWLQHNANTCKKLLHAHLSIIFIKRKPKELRRNALMMIIF